MNTLNPNIENENTEQHIAASAINAAHHEGFASYTTSLGDLDQTVAQLTETMATEQAKLLASRHLDDPKYGSTDFESRSFTMKGSQAFLGQLDAAGPKGITAVVITGGEGTMPVLSGRKAAELELRKGTVVIFGTDSEKRQKLPWFDIKSDGDIESVWIENGAAISERRNALMNEPSIGALGRRAIREAMGNQQAKAAKRLARRLK